MKRLRALKINQMWPLFGGRRALVIALVLAAMLGGLCEAAVLATIAQAASALVTGTPFVRIDLGPVHLVETIGSLLIIALVLAFMRLLLQGPLSVLPATIAADVQARLQRNLFQAYTAASWAEQSRDREATSRNW